MRRIVTFIALAYAIAGVAAADLAPPSAIVELLSVRSGGDATTDVRSASAFTQHADSLDAAQLQAFAYGNRIFSTPWVEAPASVRHFDGLGPYFSSRSCSGCHLHDGRGRPPEGPADSTVAMVVKLGRVDASGRRTNDPRYGGSLSERAVRSLAPEGRLAVTWEDVEQTYGDGTHATLRRPRSVVTGLAYGPLARDTRTSLRVAPAVFGVGLLESVPDSVLMRLADPNDADGDRISGRVHALGGGTSGPPRLGRFGWKAAQPSVAGQVATALVEDMGITTPARPEPDLGAGQRAARARPNGGRPELEGVALEALVRYCRLLAVPARRDLDDPAVQRGAARFREAGCASCHVPSLVTGAASLAPLSRQVIHPFSDLLLHDMGPELSDDMPEGDAAAAEWRTPPLWGMGLAAMVSGHRFFLHDGRARSPEEAVLWHGGEANASREAFRSLAVDARRDLLRFLESL
jgi:CxxC motif-containing protein (DUF1111 family)